jgi:hypothetical protein
MLFSIDNYSSNLLIHEYKNGAKESLKIRIAAWVSFDNLTIFITGMIAARDDHQGFVPRG